MVLVLAVSQPGLVCRRSTTCRNYGKLKKWGQKVTVSDRLNLDKDADENNTKIGDIIGDDTEQKKGDPRLLHQLTDGTKFLSISFD